MTPEEFTTKLAAFIDGHSGDMSASVLSDEPTVIGVDDNEGGLFFVQVTKAS